MSKDPKDLRFSVRSVIAPETNWLGVVLFLAYLATTFYYLITRVSKTMDTGYRWCVALPPAARCQMCASELLCVFALPAQTCSPQAGL
jgi:hypothetical protein